MNINDFKDLLLELFKSSKWEINLNDGMLKMKHEESQKELTLSEQEFCDTYNKLNDNGSGKYYELLFDNYYEVILMADYSGHYLREEQPIEQNDSTNKISYKYDKLSKELTLSFLLHMNNKDHMHLYRLILFRMSRIDSVDNTNILDSISECILRNYGCLKISTQKSVSLEKFQSLALSYTYSYMYNRQIPMYLYEDIQPKSNWRTDYSRNKDFDYPKRIYNSELISYYSEAISSTILSHKFLSFYHILEFFYEKIFSEDQIKKARAIITDVSFSYKRDKDIEKLIRCIQQKTIDEEITINEKKALKLLINRHIKQDILKGCLIDRYGEDYISVLNNKVSFSNGNAIIFSDDESQFEETLTDRIYKTRNSIVHSKDSFAEEKKKNKYKRIQDDEELVREIALIQVMAEIMINEDSKSI